MIPRILMYRCLPKKHRTASLTAIQRYLMASLLSLFALPFRVHDQSGRGNPNTPYASCQGSQSPSRPPGDSGHIRSNTSAPNKLSSHLPDQNHALAPQYRYMLGHVIKPEHDTNHHLVVQLTFRRSQLACARLLERIFYLDQIGDPAELNCRVPFTISYVNDTSEAAIRLHDLRQVFIGAARVTGHLLANFSKPTAARFRTQTAIPDERRQNSQPSTDFPTWLIGQP